MEPFYCVAVHGGAGVHNPSHDTELRRSLKTACSKAIEVLKDDGSASRAVIESISYLEDEEGLNAGTGSNLTLEGQVECDAAIMEGRTEGFGSVSAVSGVANPIQLAGVILEHTQLPDPLGRIAPLTLVGHGAHSFAQAHGVPLRSPESMVTPRAIGEWIRWSEALRKSSETTLGDGPSTSAQGIQDTVGAVALARSGDHAAGVSSGGLLLKAPGRVGEAAIFGAGCWANEVCACSVSGAGEYIIRAALARSVGEAFGRGCDDPHEMVTRILVDDFWIPYRRRGVLHPNAGLILLTTEMGSDGHTTSRLWCAFTTESMAIAYASSNNPKPKISIFRRPRPADNSDRPSIFITSVRL